VTARARTNAYTALVGEVEFFQHRESICVGRVELKRLLVTPQSSNNAMLERQAKLLHTLIASLMREFRLEPGMLAGSPYAELHANDVELFELLAQPDTWSVHAIARALHAPISTVSSALDRLERRGLIRRVRIASDRRMMCIELTPRGNRLAGRLRKTHVRNCRAMLARLHADERKRFLRLVAQVSEK
jgi:DNA-binding MarR family transcriptional regulator